MRPECAPHAQYPLEQLGVYVHSFEVQPNRASFDAMPPARHFHATGYAKDPSMAAYWGNAGVVIVFGGTSFFDVLPHSWPGFTGLQSHFEGLTPQLLQTARF
eukprot:364869-Chlamydomonas_euryale.AAC.11